MNRDSTLAAALLGDRMFNSLYEINFREQAEWRAVCHVRLRKEETDAFIAAIKEDYMYVIQLYPVFCCMCVTMSFDMFFFPICVCSFHLVAGRLLFLHSFIHSFISPSHHPLPLLCP